MWTYRGEKYAGDRRVGERTTSREGVGCAACRGGDDAAVGLDDGEQMGVAVEFKIGDVG